MNNLITDDTILDCGHKPSKHDSFTIGYGYDKDHKTFCYDCCAKNDMETMRKNKSIVLYLTKNDGKYYVSNWPGSLKIAVGYIHNGKHNIAGSRTDVWFAFENKNWHGIHYGHNSELCYCKELKK